MYTDHRISENCFARGFVSRRRSVVQLAVAGFASLVLAHSVGAAPMPLVASQNPVGTSAFTLDFSPFGGISSANITSTEYELVIDPALGTARFADYVQHVEPLLLPDGQGGGISTGDITVEIINSISGTFDRGTGTFITSDVYAVHFTGDLTAFGITSPFVLPSTSTGRVTFNTVAAGETNMVWAGTGQIAFLPFQYNCAVKGVFITSIVTGYIASSSPETGAIDAREPHSINNAAAVYGWDSVDVTFNGTPLAAVTPADFEVAGVAADGSALAITALYPTPDADTFRVTLSEPMQPGTWAVFTHVASDTSICLGFLPGDANGDGWSNARDIPALINSLNQVPGRLLPDYGTDINRSGGSNAADITQLINVLNGAGEFDRWAGRRLGPAPCQ